MRRWLARLQHAGCLSPLDCQFARMLDVLSPETPDCVLLAAALVSRGVSLGHVCVDLNDWQALLVTGEDAPSDVLPTVPEFATWIAQLRNSNLVSGGASYRPLVLDDQDRLYLQRYWRYQQILTDGIHRRIQEAGDPLPSGMLEAQLDRFFPSPDSLQQRRAAICVAQGRFSVIAGGPGTGKTSVVLNIVALLQEIARASGNPPLRFDLLAPTGKAAARLSETMRRRRASLPVDDEIKALVPVDASTIHRRLGLNPERPGTARYDQRRPLPTDVVFVDEASMVDLPLMAKLEQAIPRHATWVLLGDPDQLASVEVGAVFGDICRSFATRDAAIGPQPSAEKPTMVTLSQPFRFSSTSELGALAQSVKAGEFDRTLALCAFDDASPSTDQAISAIALEHPSRLPHIVARHIKEGFLPFFKAQSHAERLARIDSYRVLCALRSGPFGSEAMNRVVESILAAEGLIDSRDSIYRNRPIMITKNDYRLALFNGDVGVIMPDESGQRKAYFSGEGNRLRAINPTELPPHETAYCLTIHKAQGSEFDRVLLILPPHESRILSRELIYTGVTRARRGLTLAGNPNTLRSALSRRIRRPSGIEEALRSQSAEEPT